MTFAAALLVLAAAAEGPVLVAPLRPAGVAPDLASTLGELLAGELSGKMSRPVRTQAEIAQRVKAGAEAQALGADEDPAVAAKRLSADFLVTGSVGRIGRVFVLTLEVAGMNDSSAAVLSGRQSRFTVLAEGEVEGLVAAAGKAAEGLAGALVSPAEEAARREAVKEKFSKLFSGEGGSGSLLGGGGGGSLSGSLHNVIGDSSSATAGIAGLGIRGSGPGGGGAGGGIQGIGTSGRRGGGGVGYGSGAGAPPSARRQRERAELVQDASSDPRADPAWRGLAGAPMQAGEESKLAAALKLKKKKSRR